ncbi:MAG: rhomboid family intramembrane serine protease [Opitutaceae bacterium]|nr:rhomboid family intramembrane serine protease [Cephaloticoccus sp.]MCP5530770.1 rhomboid family intramembrane serine protease [Opitutaceae bacterium]
MLSDRSYMRDDYRPPQTSVVVWLIAAIVAGFLLQTIFLRWFGVGRSFVDLFALSVDGITSGKVWTLLTYSFLHSPSNLLHVIANLLGLYFLGRELLPVMGSKRFLWFYGAAAASGGLLWLAANWTTGGVVWGASAAVYGLLTIFACFYPNRQVTFLLFFVVPVTVKPKYVAYVLLGLDLCGFLFYEIMGAASPFGFAHSAHLGGMLAGWVYYRYIHEGKWSFGRAASFEMPKWARKRETASASAPKYKVNLTDRSDLRAEVDRILDKINSQGFGSLTDEEKRVLDSAKDLLSRR